MSRNTEQCRYVARMGTLATCCILIAGHRSEHYTEIRPDGWDENVSAHLDWFLEDTTCKWDEERRHNA